MNYIGEKIKELRRKNELTQDKLAEMRSVSYQTVSKWECGVSCPDIYMLAPLARLFGITTDELLGVTTGDARRAEYDAAYENYWQKDISTMYQAAQAAVSEFPGEMKYLEWLASMEYYAAFDEEYRNGGSDENFKKTMEKSVKHYKTVIENTNDEKTKRKAIAGIVMSLKYLERIEEAKQYAELAPDEAGATRDEIFSYFLSGGELLDVNRRRLYTALVKVMQICNDIAGGLSPKDPYRQTVIDAEEAIIKAAVTDDNYLRFLYYLFQLYISRSACAVEAGKYDDAVDCLKTAKEYAKKQDSLYNTGRYQYTCPLFCGYKEEWRVEESCLHDSMDFWKYCVGTAVFNPIRDREDFQALLD